MTTRVRRIPGALFFAAALGAMVHTGSAFAQNAAPLDTMFDGYKDIASDNWSVKNNAVAQWTAMRERFKQQVETCQPTDGCAKFKLLVQSLSGKPTLEQLKTVRRAESSIPYIEDIKNYDKTDFWATPYEMLSKNGGDTEDYAILSYYALRAAGMPAAAMRVMAVKVRSLGGIGLALLAVDTTPEPQILDSRVPTIMAASLVGKEYQPAVAVNEEFWWVYVLKPQ